MTSSASRKCRLRLRSTATTSGNGKKKLNGIFGRFRLSMSAALKRALRVTLRPHSRKRPEDEPVAIRIPLGNIVLVRQVPDKQGGNHKDRFVVLVRDYNDTDTQI
jgi:hypothetical protein